MKIVLKIRYYKCCIMTELISAKESILLKVTIANNARFSAIGFPIMDSNFNIPYAMVAMICQCCVLI